MEKKYFTRTHWPRVWKAMNLIRQTRFFQGVNGEDEAEPLVKSSIYDKVKNFKDARIVRNLGLYPYFRPISSAQDTEVMIDGKKVLMLGSNSYLGLTNHPKIKEAAKAAIDKYGTGCAGSRFLNGTLDIHLQLEDALAKLVNKEAALLYSTGFQVNLGVIGALVKKGEHILADKSDHASIVEGCHSAEVEEAKLSRFLHNDMSALEKKLEGIGENPGKLIVVDGVYSMEGDIANLPKICELASKYNAQVMVDDAHGIGVMGEKGAGTVSHFNLNNNVYLIMGTFSKSLASLGGFIASDAKTIDYLRHHSRPLIFSASMSPANAGATLAALEIMVSEPERIKNLWHNTRRMRQGLRSMGYNTGNSETPILPVYIGDTSKTFENTLKDAAKEKALREKASKEKALRENTLKAFRLSYGLQQEGVFVNPIVPPGVSPGKELIRISVMATHTDKQIDYALDKLQKVGKKVGILK